MIREMLESTVATWEKLGHPALLERFVLRNGRLFEPTKRRLGRPGPPKNCYQNATNLVLRERQRRPIPLYVEGFTVIKDLPVLAIQHSWVSMTGEDAMDPTLNAANHEYFGVAFSLTQLVREITKNKVYGLLDLGLGLNTKLMFSIDPPLEAICREVVSNRKGVKL